MLRGITQEWRLRPSPVEPTFWPMAANETSLLKFWREKRGLTQAQLGALARTGQQQIDKLEKNKRGMSSAWMIRLAPHLQIEPCDLFPGHDPAQRERELEILQVFRALPPDEQKRITRMAAALAEPVPIAGDAAQPLPVYRGRDTHKSTATFAEPKRKYRR